MPIYKLAEVLTLLEDEGTGASLRITRSGDMVYNPGALIFGGNGVDLQLFERSWLGFAHFTRANANAAWTQTMTIESTGRWRFPQGAVVVGQLVASSFNLSDSRIKDNVEDIPEHDAIHLLKTVFAKT